MSAPVTKTKNRISRKAASFTESVIREMTREAMKYGAVNLGQGFPDWAAPEDIKQKAMAAIEADFDRDELRSAFNERTKGIIICNPNNPTGKVFTRDEMEFIADLCKEFDALCFTDEIYEHIIFSVGDNEPAEHICMANLPGMRERTVIVNSMSKTYSVTG